MDLRAERLQIKKADVAELADALVSGSSEAIHVGSSPVVRTRFQKSTRFECFFTSIRAETGSEAAER